MKHFLGIFSFFCLFNFNLFAQLVGETNPCPEQGIRYEWTKSSQQNQAHYYTWIQKDVTKNIELNRSPRQTNNYTFFPSWPNGVSEGKITVVIETKNSDWTYSKVDEAEMTVYPKYLGNIAYNITQSTDPSPCGVRQVTFSVPPVTNATHYEWSLPSGWSGSSNSNSIVAVTDLNGGGQVRVTARLDNCIFSRTATLNVSRPNPRITSFNASAVTTCSSITVSVSAENASSYEWSTPTGTITTSSNSISVSTTGLVSVRAYSASCQTWSNGSQSKSIWVGPPPTPTGIANYSGDNCTYPFYQATFGTEEPSGLQFRWYLDGSVVGSSTNLYKYRFNDDNYHHLRVEVSNVCGSSEYSTYIKRDCPTFLAYPNPAKDKLHIKFDKINKDEDIPAKISLSNGFREVKQYLNSFQNQALLAQFKQNKLVVFDVSELPEGIYFLHVEFKHGVEKRQIMITK